MKQLVGILIITALVITMCSCSQAQASEEGFSKQQEAFRDLKYGCFIHWNHSAIRGDQISWCRGSGAVAEEYDALVEKFAAKDFDADQWAQILKDSGFSYVVLVPKHHDGFCMFETKSTNYNVIEKSPFGKDFIKLTANALRKKDIKVCLYYSIMDWTEPTYSGAKGADLTAYKKVMYQQLDELFSNYGPITAIWFDGNWDPSWTQEQGRHLYNFVKSKQPDCLISNRVAPMPKAPGPIGSRVGSFSDESDKIGEYLTPERKMGAFFTDYPWETCLPLDKNNKWSWMPPFDNRDKKEIVQWILQAAGGGGNLLLGIGPDEHGMIDSYHAERLMEVGLYLKLYGHTVYGTRPGPYKPGKWGGISLHKGNKVYLHFLDWKQEPKDGHYVIKLPALPARITSSKLLTGTVDRHGKNYSLNVEQTSENIVVKIHIFARRPNDTIVELTLDKDAGDIELIDMGDRTLIEDHTPPPGETSNV